MKVLKIKSCADCPYHESNGHLQANPKYICSHEKVSVRNKVEAHYWYDWPIIIDSKTIEKQYDVLDNVPIPCWCPLENI